MGEVEDKQVLIAAMELFFRSISPEFERTIEVYDKVPTYLRKPDCGIRQWKLRFLPVVKLPRKFWTSKWCYYEMGVGPNGGGNLETATCAFMWAPDQQPQGGGFYSQPVDRVLKVAEAASNGAFQMRRIGPKGSSQLLCCSFKGYPDPKAMANQMKWLVENTLKSIQSIPSL